MLARRCAEMGLAVYKIRPKLHMQAELLWLGFTISIMFPMYTIRFQTLHVRFLLRIHATSSEMESALASGSRSIQI